MRKFEKISLKQFKKDFNDEKLYETYNLPSRSTTNSAGYDFYAVDSFCLKPGENKKIPTGIKADMENDEVLLLIVRSSMGFKYNVRLTNQVGVIDSDYYNNVDNEGHIWINLQNHGDKEYNVNKGDKIIQGMFIKYLLTDDDDTKNKMRIGGIGSTNKEEI